jgi:hypothetical protein
MIFRHLYYDDNNNSMEPRSVSLYSQTLAAARDNSRKALDYVDDVLAVLRRRTLKVEGTDTVQADATW